MRPIAKPLEKENSKNNVQKHFVFLFHTPKKKLLQSRSLFSPPQIFLIGDPFERVSYANNFMIFILGASSLHHALETLPPDEKNALKEKIYTIPGLSLNFRAKNPKKVVQNLLAENFSEKTDIVIWHDVLNNSLSKHKSNNYRPLSVPELLDVLDCLKNKLRALVYCHRNRTPDIFEALKQQSISVFSIEKDFTSTRKQKDPNFLNELKALHQKPELELKHLDIVLRNEADLNKITEKNRPKRLSKRARKALKNAASSPSVKTPPALAVVGTVSKLHCLVEVSTSFPLCLGCVQTLPSG